MNYALIALGSTLIFAIMGVLNFAHGQMYVLGGFVTYYVYGVFGLNYFVALAASAVTVACIGLVFERFLFRRVLRITTREESTMLLAAGTALLLDSLGLALFGEKQRGVAPVVAGVYEIFGAFVPASRALIFVLAGGLVGALLVAFVFALLLYMREVLVLVRRIHAQEIMIVRELVDQNVIHKPAALKY